MIAEKRQVLLQATLLSLCSTDERELERMKEISIITVIIVISVLLLFISIRDFTHMNTSRSPVAGSISRSDAGNSVASPLTQSLSPAPNWICSPPHFLLFSLHLFSPFSLL